MRLNFARLVLSQSWSVLRDVVSFRLRIISLMLSFSSSTWPAASTVIDRVRSPLVTAVATSAMALTWVVRFPASWLTLFVRSSHEPAAPGTRAWPPSCPSMPTSRATVVTWSPNTARVSIIPLIVSASSAISPFASRTSLRLRSPLATAVTTLAMPRTCVVRLEAIELTLSVRSSHTPATPFTTAWPPSFPSMPTSRATRVTSEAKAFSWSTIVLMVSFSSRISPFTSTVIFFDRSPRATAVVTSAILRTCAVRLLAIEFTLSVTSFHVPATPEIDARSLHDPLPLPYFACHACDLGGEGIQLVHHRVDGVLQLEDLPLHVHGDLLRQVPAGHRRRHVRDVAHLSRQVARHRVHAVGQVLPRPRHPRDHRLAPQLPLRAHLPRHARHLRREGSELVHHGVDRVLQLEDLPLDVHGDLLGEVAGGHRRRHVGDVAHLPRQVARHRVHAVGQILPRSRDPRNHRLASQLALRSHLARHTRHLRRKGAELAHHAVDDLRRPEELAHQGPAFGLQRHHLR